MVVEAVYFLALKQTALVASRYDVYSLLHSS